MGKQQNNKLSPRQYHLLKHISRFENGLPLNLAIKINQHTLGSLVYRRLVDITSKLSFLLTQSGFETLEFYSSVGIKRKIAGKWAKVIHIQKVKVEMGTRMGERRIEKGLRSRKSLQK